jgi:glycosyltransferase domain-containing protein
MTPRLTIVMPLKGRHLFTFRFLWHANRMRLPYRFLIADGQFNEAVAHRLEDSREIFPEIDVEYVRYPDDVDYSRYFAKMSDALQRVRTPYVMHADNDDFLAFNGVERMLDFLDAHNDYVCSRGHYLTFSVYSGLGGSLGDISGKFNRFYLYRDFKDATASTAIERLRECGLDQALYYAVYRTDALAGIWREIAEIDFSELTLQENFVALRALTLGKVHTDEKTITYYSQAGTGISYQPLRQWAHHLLSRRFTSELHAMIERISSAGAEAGGANAAAIAEEVGTILERYYENLLSYNYGALAQIKRAMRKKWPRAVSYVRTRPRFFIDRELAVAFAELTNAGASQNDLDRIRGELAEIERALSPEAFADFSGPFVSMAGASSSRDWLYISDPRSGPQESH